MVYLYKRIHCARTCEARRRRDMITISRIKKDFGGPICRSCINNRYSVKLSRKHCRYEKHSDVCPSCGERKHIVKRLSLLGYLKGIGKKPVPPHETRERKGEEDGNA